MSQPVYSLRFRIVAVLVALGAALAFAVAYLSSQEGDDQIATSGQGGEFVERLIPARNAQVPRQSTVGIDMAVGWTGTLVVNGTEIPADELSVTEELGLVQFTPGEGRAVEELRAGQNRVTAIVWPRSEGREGARTVDWTFDVV